MASSRQKSPDDIDLIRTPLRPAAQAGQVDPMHDFEKAEHDGTEPQVRHTAEKLAAAPKLNTPKPTPGGRTPRKPKQEEDFHRAGYLVAEEDRAPSGARTPTVMVTLPPYVIAYPAGEGVHTYAFVVPAGLRPKNWPALRQLGSDHGQGPGAIRAHAWNLYGELLHAMHMQQREFENQLHPATLRDAAERYREDYNRRQRAHDREEKAERQRHLEYGGKIHKVIDKILDWAELNAFPPMATIGPEHVFAFLLTYGETHNEQRELKAGLSELYKTGMRHGYTDTNPTLGLRLPAASGRTPAQIADIRQDLRVFTRPPLLHPSVDL
jgi:hypothetical protein